MQQSKRVAYLDLMKCLLLFLVIWHHVFYGYRWYLSSTYAYVIPGFFFMSGLTFRRAKYSNFLEFAKKKAKVLLLPYVIFSVVTWVFWAALQVFTHSGADIWPPLLQTLIAQGSGSFFVHNTPLWFIPCLYVMECLYFFIDKLPERFNALTSIACSTVGAWMISGEYSCFFSLLPWSTESALAAMVFYCAGNILTKHVSLQKLETLVLSHRVTTIISACILTAILLFLGDWNGHVSLGSDTLGKNPFVYYINAFTGIYVVTILCILLCSIDVKCTLYNKLHSYNLWFGRHSYDIMATHVPIKGVLMVAISHVLSIPTREAYGIIPVALAAFILTCAVCSLLAIAIERTKGYFAAKTRLQ